MNDQNTVYKAKLHWIIFVGPFLLLCVLGFLDLKWPELHQMSFYFAIVAFIWAGIAWFNYHFSSLLIKTKQVILCTGFFSRQTIDIPLNKIESVDIRQSLLGSILQYGTLIITGTGGTRQMIDYLNKPLTCRRYIEQLMHG